MNIFIFILFLYTVFIILTFYFNLLIFVFNYLFVICQFNDNTKDLSVQI